MHKVSGGCHCGNILVGIELARAPITYSPRACDCTFCRKHGASYVSDAQGYLLIGIKDDGDTSRYRQGSGVAECLICRKCGILIGACYQSSERLYGVVNVKVIDTQFQFGAEQPVSPKQLSESEKVARWQEIWFSNVQVIHGGA